MSDKTTLTYDDCTIGANEPIDKYTLNRVFRRCLAVAKDRSERIIEVSEQKPYAASEDTPGVVRFINGYKDNGQFATTPNHILNLEAFKQYSDNVFSSGTKLIRKDINLGTSRYTKLNEATVNLLPNGVKIMTGSFVVGFNKVNLETLKSAEVFHDMDTSLKKDQFYRTMLKSGTSDVDGKQYKYSVVYVPYIDRARMDEYNADKYNNYMARGELSENLFEMRMRSYRVTSDASSERNQYIVEALYNLSFSIQDFVTYCDLVDVGYERKDGKKVYGEVALDQTKVHDSANRFYFFRKPVIMVQAIDVAPTYNLFNKMDETGELIDLEQPISSGVDTSVYHAPRNTVFVENFSCDYDVGGTSDMLGDVQNNNLTIGLSSRFVIGDERDNIGYASANKLNHKIKVTFMLMGV